MNKKPPLQTCNVKWWEHVTPIQKDIHPIGAYLQAADNYLNETILTRLKEGEVPISGTLLDQTGILVDYFPEDIAEIVEGQLEGYGYCSAEIMGQIVKCDMEYSNEQLCIESATPDSLLEDAIVYRYDLLTEEFGDEKNFPLDNPSVKEYMQMEDFQSKRNLGSHKVNLSEMKASLEKKKEKEADISDKPKNKTRDLDCI